MPKCQAGQKHAQGRNKVTPPHSSGGLLKRRKQRARQAVDSHRRGDRKGTSVEQGIRMREDTEKLVEPIFKN